jgi:hypothetical protein
MGMKGQTFMLKAAHRFKFFAAGLAAIMICAVPAPADAEKAPEIKKTPHGLYRDVFDQNIYYEGTNYLRLNRLYRLLFRKKRRAANVNVFDEVPDSAFFTNRHGRERLSTDALSRGASVNDGPDLSGNLTVTKGKTEGLHPGFFVRDAKGDGYLLKFDPPDYLELVTGAEVVGSRFFHAIGYNVPQYTVVVFNPEKLVPGKDAKVIDATGFTKPLTKEKLEEFLLFIPWDSEGRFRASASLLLSGENKGPMRYQGRRSQDPNDKIDHQYLREIRGFQVFCSWLNNYDGRESNTLDMLVEKDGRYILKHYMIDFNSSLGAAAQGPKPPMFVHEHMIDYGETFKAMLGLGLWEKPWQKRWREAGEKIQSPAVGYFDNRHFEPEKFKNQLPHFAFKDVTRADGFWAAKIIAAFTDEDIQAMVKPGQYSNPEDAAYIAKTLSERRDIIVKYWFKQASPLDSFDLKGGKLTFEDLAIKYGHEKEGTYLVDVIGKKGRRGKKITSLESRQPSIAIDPGWLSEYEGLNLLIRTLRPGSEEPSPYVLVELNKKGVTGILHED